MGNIPFHIISGFLGSGKTTFLKKIIEKYSGEKRLGVIQNEFAPANIDGEELKKSGEGFHLLEVNNGSVFCVCLLGSFSRSLEKFINDVNPEVIIMEASGLSDTTSVSEIISSGKIGEKIFLASNWCVVDALNFKKAGMMKQRVVHQLRMADLIILNKTDLARENTGHVSEEIKKINPFAEILKTEYCNIGIELGAIPVKKFYFDKVKPLNQPEVRSMVIKSSRKLSLAALEKFIKEWGNKSFRIKGYVNLNSGETVAVQSTFGNYSLKKVGQSLYPNELIALTSEFTLREWNRSFKEYSSQ